MGGQVSSAPAAERRRRRRCSSVSGRPSAPRAPSSSERRAQLPSLLHDAQTAHAVPAPLRPLAGAFQTDIDRTYLLAASAYIPPYATYFFDQGSGVVSGNTASAPSARPVTEFWLYPRRPVATARQARWLICYGCDLAPWTGRVRIVWQNGPIAIGSLRR